jgi:hypothetical protein
MSYGRSDNLGDENSSDEAQTSSHTRELFPKSELLKHYDVQHNY